MSVSHKRGGVLVIVLGPSGAGKSSLVRAARQRCADVVFAPSTTTRSPRPGEHNKHYEFVDERTFAALRAAGAFLEFAAYGGNHYGTRWEAVEAPLRAGHVVVKEMEVQGVAQVLARLPRKCVRLVFVDAGPWETLKARIEQRAPLSPEEIAAREARAREEFAWLPRADLVIRNPDGALERAQETFCAYCCGLARLHRGQGGGNVVS